MSQLTDPMQQTAAGRPRVVIVGGGFGGLHAAKGLCGLPVDVTLIDRRNHHTFQPLLYQVALAVLSPAEIAQPIRGILRHNANTQVLMDEAVGIDTRIRSVILASGAQVTYDYLVLAAGSTHSCFGHDDWAKLAPGLKTIEDATEIRRRVLLAFELAERQMQEHGWHPPLNFVVIGGGPTGVELAGAITDIAQFYLRNDFRHIDPAKSRVSLLDGSPRLLATYPEDLSAKAKQQLEKLGVEIHLGCHVTGVGPGWVETGGPHQIGRIDAAVTLWAAGVQASPLGKMLGAPTDHRGCVMVDAQLNPPGLPDVFVLGDLAHFEQEGKQVPGVAQPAMQMGDHLAKMVRSDLGGKPRPAFHYFDKGDMATIGRRAAVADVKWPFKAHLSGLPAWFTWLVVHIYFLIGFRNRIAVLFTWIWSYFTFSRSARLITGDQRLPGWPERMPTEPGESAADPASTTTRAQAADSSGAADPFAPTLGGIALRSATLPEPRDHLCRRVRQGVIPMPNVVRIRDLVVVVSIILVSWQGSGQETAGSRVEAGGYKVHASLQGVGEPAVVFVSGLGEDSATWDKVVPEISRLTRTIVYDRSGLGRSEVSPAPKSMSQMLSELHTVLVQSGLKPPYVLVGHSLGGAIVELFTHNYPLEVAGLVLVDPEDSRLLDRLQTRLSKEDWDARQNILNQMMSAASPAQKAELDASRESGHLLEGVKSFPSIPVVLLTGTLKDPGFPGNPLEQDLKMEMHNELLAGMPKAKHVLAPNSRHYIQEDAPEFVIDAVRSTVEEVRGQLTEPARRRVPR